MSPTAARGALGALTVACLVAGLAVAASARPVAAATPLGTYTVTFDGVAAGRGGGIGASGGLVTFSGGPGDVAGRLDAAPSAAAQASSLEPGTMARLVAGQANDQAGEQVVGEPTTARAEFPGDVAEDEATQADPGPAGPLRVVGGRGRAVAAADRAVAVADVAGLEVVDAGSGARGLAAALAAWRASWLVGDHGPGPDAPAARAADPPALRVLGAFGDGRAVVDEAAATVTGRVSTGVAHVEVLGELVLHDVVGTATVTAAGDERTARADLAIGAVTVGGVPVADEQLVAGADARAASEQLNAALEAAGVRLRLLGARETVDGTRAAADSGGIGIHVTTPAAEGVPRNDFTVVVGRGTTTVFAEPPAPAPVTADPAGDGDRDEATAPMASPRPGNATATAAPGDTTVDLSPPAAATPQVAPEGGDPVRSDAPAVVVAGRRMSARTAYAGFAAWLLFTSTIPMLGTAWLRRRGVA